VLRALQARAALLLLISLSPFLSIICVFLQYMCLGHGSCCLCALCAVLCSMLSWAVALLTICATFRVCVCCVQNNCSLLDLEVRDNNLALEVGAALADLMSSGRSTAPATGSLGTWRELPHSQQMQAAAGAALSSLCRTSATKSSMVVSERGGGGDRALQHNAARRPVLQTVDLGCNPLLGDVGVSLLSAGLSHSGCTLRTLLLDGCGCGPTGAAALSQAVRAAAAAATTGGCGAGTAAGAAAITAPRAASGVIKQQHDGVSPGCGLHSDVCVLTGAETGCGLQHLDLSHNRLGKEGAAALATCLQQQRSLQRLVLRDCQVCRNATRVVVPSW
jgi:hypothetical protein